MTNAPTNPAGWFVLVCAAMAGVTGIQSCAREDEGEGAELRRAVEARLAASPDVDARDVDVEVDEGTVILAGEVETLLAEQEAVLMARTVPGVTHVVDRMVLAPSRTPDHVVERHVAQALMSDPGTQLAVRVRVIGGVARLDGTVEAASDIAVARRIAASVPGVGAVVDALQVRPLGPLGHVVTRAR